MNKNYIYVKRWRENHPGEELYGISKKVIFDRDNNECQICGNKNNLEIHHIDGKGIQFPKNKKNNNPDNLITLCHSCHSRIHYWQKPNKLTDGYKKNRKYKWSMKFPKCLSCGTTKLKYSGDGLCTTCYERRRKEYKAKWWKNNKNNCQP